MVPTLPLHALIDTGVFLRRLGEFPEDPGTPECVEFCDRMVHLNHRIFVAAPTITEVTRKSGRPPPALRNIVSVAFDDVAARVLGMKMPMTELRSCQPEYGCSQNHIKYDALIVGCALRIPRCVFVGLDDKQLKLARRVQLAAHRPGDFLADETRAPNPGGEQQELANLQLESTTAFDRDPKGPRARR